MKTSELIEALQDSLSENGDLEVMTSSNYGDYYKTEQLDNIENIQCCIPVKSAYSGTGMAFPTDDEDEDDTPEDEGEMVLVLRYTY
jgi:hypothetical protein